GRHTPLLFPIVLLVVGAMVTWIAGILQLAVKGERPEYVYAAELLLVLLLVHLRLNVPDLFPSFLGRHWTFVVMTVAYVGVGLSEFFHRRGLRVLAEPVERTGVFLPLLPLLAFLVRGLTGVRKGLGSLADVVPGLQPLLRYLDRLPGEYTTHALLWFL